jgi:hypothetical protein
VARRPFGHHRRQRGRAAGAACAAVVLLTAARLPAAARQAAPGGSDPLAARVAVHAPAVPRFVIALYYPWYALQAVSGADRHVEGLDARSGRPANFAHAPQGGVYDSTDPAAVRRHLRQLRSAGVDVIACSWWGVKDPTAQVVRKLLPLLRGSGISLCLYVEQLDARDGPGAAAEVAAALKGIGEDPAYLRAGGKPVVFLYRRAVEQLGYEEWAEALVRLERAAPPGVIAIGDGDTLLDALVFDGLHRSAPETPEAASATALVQLARRRRRIAVVTACPGFDDRRVSKPGLFIDRSDGGTYRGAWSVALAAQPDWVLVRSFNQWHEGSEIEPSVEFGSRYLAAKAEFAERFKRPAATAGR